MINQARCSGSINWTRRGETTGTVDIAVNLFGEGGYIELHYTFNKTEQINYRVDLVQIPSNLGKGKVWYFVCPLTGERCRTLYLTDKYFASRKAHTGTLYESQTHSKHYRWIDKTFGPELKLDGVYDQVYKRYAKKHYRGKPTPKMRKALILERAYDISKGRTPKSFDEYFQDNFR